MTRSKIPTHGVQRPRVEAVSLVRRLGTRRADAGGGVLMFYAPHSACSLARKAAAARGRRHRPPSRRQRCRLVRAQREVPGTSATSRSSRNAPTWRPGQTRRRGAQAEVHVRGRARGPYEGRQDPAAADGRAARASAHLVGARQLYARARPCPCEDAPCFEGAAEDKNHRVYVVEDQYRAPEEVGAAVATHSASSQTLRLEIAEFRSKQD